MSQRGAFAENTGFQEAEDVYVPQKFAWQT
jgi:hypothetical protein